MILPWSALRVLSAAAGLSAAFIASNAGADQIAGLVPGFYVARELSCSEVTEKQVMTVLPTGMMTPAAECEFSRVVATGPASFLVQQDCRKLGSTQIIASIATPMLVPPGKDTLLIIRPNKDVVDLKRCDQSTMPERWRTATLPNP